MFSDIRDALATILRLAKPYFRSEEKLLAWGLLIGIIVIELVLVAITVRLNGWQADFFNALQERQWDRFVAEMIFFCWIVAAFIAAAVLQYVVNAYLQIRWRRWLTERYLTRWLEGGTHYRMKMTGDAADNPDQRIAEDVRLFIRLTLSLGLRIFGQAMTLFSFIVVLWGLSQVAPLRLFGADMPIPGYLVWTALIYAVLGTWIAHLIGRKLIGLNFAEQRREADFRFALVRVRENGEAVALQRGEGVERAVLSGRFGGIVANALQQLAVQKWLTGYTAFYGQAAVIFPYILAAPAYFAGAIQIGQLMQVSDAFGRVQTALSVFIDAYSQIAEYKSVIDRLDGFDQAVGATETGLGEAGIVVAAGAAGAGLVAAGLAVATPQGREIVRLDALTLAPGERRVVVGPSGSGKTSLIRGLSGAWPWGAGRVVVPEGTRVLVLPQRPYVPLGSLRAALTYPRAADAVTDEAVRGALAAVALGHLADKLDTEENWSAILSGGEQQRVALARALLEAPDWLLLDEATSALDADMERAVFAALIAALPKTGILAITHRDAPAGFAPRPVGVTPGAAGEPGIATA